MIKKFLWSICIKKGVKRLIQALIGFYVTYGVDKTLLNTGISIDWDQLEVFLIGSGIALVTASTEIIRNFLKQKTRLKSI